MIVIFIVKIIKTFDNNLKDVILIMSLLLIMSIFLRYNMKILVCDDEQMYVDTIRQHIEMYACEKGVSFEIDCYNNAKNLLDNIKYCDIAFLDVEIGDIKGTDVARKLKEVNKYIIIFIITSYNKYLDEAMDLNVLRFIVKPIDTKRLYAGLDKALSLIDNSYVDLFLKNGNTQIKIPINEIMFIEVEGKKTKIQTKDAVYYSTDRLKVWKKRLTPTFFFQIHSSFIINMKYISQYDRDEVIIDNKYKIPIAYRKQTEFKNYFTNYFSK